MGTIFTDCKSFSQENFHNLCMATVTDCEFNAFMFWRFKEIAENELGLTQEQVAERLECSVGQVNMLYSGKRKFHNLWITRISKALNVPPWQLFVHPEKVIPREYLTLMEGYMALEPQRRRDFEDAIDAAKTRKIRERAHPEETSQKKTSRSHTRV